MLSIGVVEQLLRALGPTTDARVMTGGSAPRSTSSCAVRTLMELTIATAAIVEPGPTGVSSPSIATSASACGVHRSITRSASSSRRLPTSGLGSSAIDCSTEVTAITRRPRCRAPRAISTGTAESPLAEKTIITSRRAEREVGQDHLGQPGHPLDVHRLALAVGADDLRVERHRQLDDRVEAGVRAVAREHLLDRDPRMAGPEQVDETAAGDRVGTPLAGFGDRPGLGLAEPGEQALGLGQPVEHARVGGGRRHGVISSRSRSRHRRRPPRRPRRARARPCAPGSRRGSSGSPSRRRASRRGP